jgi:hypothetical protein
VPLIDHRPGQKAGRLLKRLGIIHKKPLTPKDKKGLSNKRLALIYCLNAVLHFPAGTGVSPDSFARRAPPAD